jgi:hypothetical protein
MTFVSFKTCSTSTSNLKTCGNLKNVCHLEKLYLTNHEKKKKSAFGHIIKNILMSTKRWKSQMQKYGTVNHQRRHFTILLKNEIHHRENMKVILKQSVQQSPTSKFDATWKCEAFEAFYHFFIERKLTF